tara:strand:- start:3881 stop:7276 length:3396 start_codon:yes stop_codon:yes gene_type:complete
MQHKLKTYFAIVFFFLCCISLSKIVLLIMHVNDGRKNQEDQLHQKHSIALHIDSTPVQLLNVTFTNSNNYMQSIVYSENVTAITSNIKSLKERISEKKHEISQNKNPVLVFVICMSHRGGFERRHAIRHSWKRNIQNAAFFVGDTACEIPYQARTTPWSCMPKRKAIKKEMELYQKELQDEEKRLQQEHNSCKDIVMLGMKDFYRALPKKLKLAYEWGIKNTQAQWFLKIDDDSVVRIGALHFFLRRIDTTRMYVVGSIRRQASVPKSGKWSDPNYSLNTYPTFANGAEGHVVSRKVAENVYLFNGIEYQGEDVSLGIWISEMKLPVIWKDVTGLFVNNGDCYNEKYIVIGHNISPDKMLACFKKKTDLETKKNKTIYHNLVGRLGNQLFQIASIFGIASKNNAHVCLNNNEIGKYFDGLPESCISAKDTKKLESLSEHGEYAKYHEFTVTENVEITGYLQSYRYFSSDVRSMLKFKNYITDIATQTLKGFSSKTLVGIHIRRYELNYLRNPSSQYFINAKYFFTSRYNAVQFVVTCEDIKWCNRQHFLSAPDVFIVSEQNDAVIDMAILSACDHIILSVGTFGWWAAFLGADAKGGTVLYYDSEFVMEHKINRGNVVLEDFYPHKWIAMPSTPFLINTINKIPDVHSTSLFQECTKNMTQSNHGVDFFHANKGQQNKIYEHPEKLPINATIIDAGGFTGRDLAVFRRNAEKLSIDLDAMHVEIFEPHPVTFDKLISNIGSKPSWLSVNNYGLSDNNTKLCMQDGTDAASTVKKTKCSVSVKVKDIAEVIKRHARIDLLHINCEGCEIPILNRVLETCADKVQTIEVQMHKKYVSVQEYCKIATALSLAGYNRVYHYAYVWEAWTRVNTLHTLSISKELTKRSYNKKNTKKKYSKCAWSPLSKLSWHKAIYNQDMMQTYNLMTTFYKKSIAKGIQLGALISGQSRCYYMFGEFCQDASDCDIDISNGDPIHQPPHSLRDIIPITNPYKLSWDSSNFDSYGKCECIFPNNQTFVCLADIERYLRDMYGISWWVPIPGLKISVLQKKESRTRYIDPIFESLSVYQNSNHEIDRESLRNILLQNNTDINHNLIEKMRNEHFALYSNKSDTDFSAAAMEMDELFQYLKRIKAKWK